MAKHSWTKNPFLNIKPFGHSIVPKEVSVDETGSGRIGIDSKLSNSPRWGNIGTENKFSREYACGSNDNENKLRHKPTWGMIVDEDTQMLPEVLNEQKKQPEHPEMLKLFDRFNSFQLWPIQMTQTPKKMAEAGFFYSNKGDTVTCFWCGKSIYKWEANEDPISEHKNHFGACKFLEMISM